MTTKVTLTDFCNSAHRPLEVSDISFQLHIDAFPATQSISTYSLYWCTEVVKVTCKVSTSLALQSCNTRNNYCVAYLFSQPELVVHSEHGKNKVRITKSAFKLMFYILILPSNLKASGIKELLNSMVVRVKL